MAEMEDTNVNALEATSPERNGAANAGVAGAEQTEKPYEFVNPYESELFSKITKFYKGRKKSPYDFTYTAKGDLEVLEGARIGKRGRPWAAMTLSLKSFIPLTVEERTELEERRQAEIGRIQDEYETVSEELQLAWQQYRQSGAMREVLLANQKMREIDARLSAVLFAERDVVGIRNPTTKQVLFNEPYEERKLIEPGDPFSTRLYRLAKYTFPQFVEFGNYVDSTETTEAEEEEAEEGEIPSSEVEFRKKLSDGRIARIFFESSNEKNGFLSPMYPVKFTYKDGEYFTAYQAYEVLRAEELQLPDQVKTLMGTTSTRTMRLATMKSTKHPADARNLWLGIFTAVYQQYPILQKQLLDTGTDALVYAEVRPGPSGVGLAEKDSKILNPAQWKGENYVGLALETIRTRLREETLEEAPREEEVTKKVISEEEQKAAKVGAIINARRRARG
jgi:predicted NAD-dependent protein-ADP-ribosyltransferase YbiA (DUF1768 family)